MVRQMVSRLIASQLMEQVDAACARRQTDRQTDRLTDRRGGEGRRRWSLGCCSEMSWGSDLGENPSACAIACAAVVRQRLQRLLAVDRSKIDPALAQQCGLRNPTHHVETSQDRIDVATEGDRVGSSRPTLPDVHAFNQVIERDDWGDFRCKVWSC